MVAKRVRDSLPSKLSAHWEVNLKSQDVLKEISLNTAEASLYPEDASLLSAADESRVSIDVEETEKLPEIFQTLKESFLKAYKVMDRELRSYTNIDCFCSGTTAVTLIKQVLDRSGNLNLARYYSVFFGRMNLINSFLFFAGPGPCHRKCRRLPSSSGYQRQRWFSNCCTIDSGSEA